MADMIATHTYIATAPCGCVRAACVDCGDNDTALAVAGWIKDGYAVDRITHAEFSRRWRETGTFMGRCPHGKDNAQRALFAEQS